MTQRPTEKELCCTYPGCLASRLKLDDTNDTETYARAAGWHIWSGLTVSGQLQEVALCPGHAGNHKIEKAARPEWDEPLW